SPYNFPPGRQLYYAKKIKHFKPKRSAHFRLNERYTEPKIFTVCNTEYRISQLKAPSIIQPKYEKT
ncbi:10436_t:CDS:1, partial [Funneliformis mosseae]